MSSRFRTRDQQQQKKHQQMERQVPVHSLGASEGSVKKHLHILVSFDSQWNVTEAAAVSAIRRCQKRPRA
jgi:hypothetical protein